MKKLTQEELLEQGYKIKNACIADAELAMVNQGQGQSHLVLLLNLKGDDWMVTYGGYSIGRTDVSADGESFEGTSLGTELIMRMLDIIGVDKFRDATGKHVRAAIREDGKVKIIGNIVTDKWFDIEAFFSEVKPDSETTH
jgi:hypothetical protein